MRSSWCVLDSQRMASAGVLVAVMASAACGPRMATRPRFGDLDLVARTDVFHHGIRWFQLANGMRVAMIPDQRTNLVTVEVRYAVGAADDPPGQAGLAHLVEHLTFELRAAPEAPGLGARLTSIALENDASTTWDETRYAAVALHQELGPLLSLEAERMEQGCAHIPADVFARERQVVLREIAQRDTDDLALVRSLLTAVYPEGHPYRRSVGGEGEVAAVSLDQVCRFLADHYVPERAVLVVGGHLDPAATAAQIERRFGRITRRAATARAPIPALQLHGGTSEVSADVGQSTAILVFSAPPARSPTSVQVDLAARLLESRLWAATRANPFLVGVDHGRLGGTRAGALCFMLEVRRPEDLPRAVDLLFRERARLLADPDLLKRVQRVVATMEVELIGGMSDLAGRGATAADYLLNAGDPTLMARDLLRLERLEYVHIFDPAIDRKRVHVIIVRPRPGRTPGRRIAIPAAATAVDVDTGWRAPVDPSEADRTLVMPATPTAPEVRELRLDNGLRVLLAVRPEHPLIDARMIFPIGSDADPQGRVGLAETAAHLLDHDFEGRYPEVDVYRIGWVLERGTQLDAEVGRDTTRIRARGLALYADWHVWRLHWLLEQGVYEQKALDYLRAEARRRTALPGRRGTSIVDRALGQTPDPELGMDRIGTDELQAFRRAHYRTRGATLVVVGKFDADEMEREIRSFWGTWSDDAPPPRKSGDGERGRSNCTAGPHYLHGFDETSVQPTIAIAFQETEARVPAAASGVLASIIEERVAAVRERLGASYGIHLVRNRSNLVIRGEVAPERAGEALRLLLDELGALREAPMPGEFVRARKRMFGLTLAEAADVTSIANRLEFLVSHRLPLDFTAQRARAIASLTLADLATAAEAQLAAERMRVVVVGRAAVVKQALEVARITASRRID